MKGFHSDIGKNHMKTASTASKESQRPARKPKSETVKNGRSRPVRDGQDKVMESTAETSSPETAKVCAEPHARLLPRVLRLKDAPAYLGMDRNRFNKEVRPGLIEVPIGKQGIGFDRFDLDAWFDEYKHRNGRPGQHHKGDESWDAKKYRASSSGATAGTSTSKSEAAEFAKALAKATSRKRKNTLPAKSKRSGKRRSTE
jgi:hypothetical protein